MKDSFHSIKSPIAISRMNCSDDKRFVPKTAMFQTHPRLFRIIIAIHALANFFRRYSDGRQPIHLVNAFENTNGF